MAEGLEYLHSNNVIHGDIHKGNVLANRDETGSIHPVYIDFGLSKILEDSSGQTVITSSIRQKGYMRYMAPELLRYIHPPRHKASDIYALGLLLLEVSIQPGSLGSSRFKWDGILV
ncbi:Eukaryotic translation initiation factor 2 alpha kinase 4 [Tulasnella sp. 408]|nr:Eukaryotic translation initiation factor 2 alpha kinase 4 [Tulasnella sp. 408]